MVSLRRNGRAHNGIAQTGDCRDVSGRDLLYLDPSRSHDDARLHDTIGSGHAGYVKLHAAMEGSGEEPSRGNLACMRVDLQLVDHESDWTLGIAGCHGFADGAIPVAMPDDLDPLLLGLDGAGKELDYHIVYGPE